MQRAEERAFIGWRLAWLIGAYGAAPCAPSRIRASVFQQRRTPIPRP